MPKSPTTSRARRLRQNSNAPEDAAWQALRVLRAHGFPVRRQHPIENMIVDFAIAKARLVIEIDRIPAQKAMSPDHLLRLVQEKLGI